ncbi:MAG: MFS transporter [Bilophila sp.]
MNSKNRQRADVNASALEKVRPSGEQRASLRSIIIAVSTAQFLLPFMMSGVSPLLPAIGADLHASAMELGLVGAVYSLSLSIFHLIAGRIGDMKGRRKLFLIGLAIFIIMSVVTPLSPTMTLFLVCRFVQAVGTAMMNTSALAILIASSPPAMRGRVLGISSVGLFAGISCGPAIGGVIGSTLGWPYLFFCVVPLGIVAWLLMAFTVKGDWTSNPDQPFDWKGAVLYSLGICGISLGATWIALNLWGLGLLLVGFVFIALFIKAELRLSYPILDVRFIVHNSTFVANILVLFLVNCYSFGLLFYYSLYLQGIQHLSVLHTGLVLSVQPGVQLLFSPWAGKLADRHGATRIALLGLLLGGVGLFMAARLNAGSALWEVPLAQVWVGAGLAFFAAPNTSAIMGSVDLAHLSQASGLLGTIRTMGMLSSMVIVSVSMNRYLGLESLNPGNTVAFLEAMHMNISLFSLLNILGILLSFWQLHHSRGRQS